MPKSLLIVESPTKARTLARYLGQEFLIEASVGHIKDLPKSRLGVDIAQDFLPEYVYISGKKKIIGKIKRAAAKVKDIYLGPDPDREGEAIAWHLAEEVRGPGKNIYRALFNELTEKAVRRAIGHPAKLDGKKYEAQQARRILDRLVGYQISPLLWEKVRRGLSAGRVQTVALRLICERERAIASFAPEEYWSITARLEGSQPPEFEARLIKFQGEDVKITNQEQAQAVLNQLNGAAFLVDKVEVKERSDYPGPPFITSTLQQEAHNRLGFAASKTMRLAQRLYEGVELKKEGPVGLITYMRTDSTRLSPEAVAQARQVIGRLFGPDFVPARALAYKSKKGAQDAHEAIRPTDPARLPEEIRHDLEPALFALYDLIWRRFLACQMTPAIVETTGIDVAAGQHLFRATATRVKFHGYLKAYPRRKEEEGDTGLPSLSQGEALTLKELLPKQHFTEPPPRYSEASLIKELERLGIGRPSTYAAILTNVQERNYSFKEKGKFHATDLGLLVVDLLVEAFPRIFDVKFTAAMEQKLDEIEAGKGDALSGLRRFYKHLSESLFQAKRNMRDVKAQPLATDVVCPKCGKNMVIKWGRTGQFLACSAYPECDSTSDFLKDEAGIIQPVRAETGEICEKCGQPMVVKASRYGRFLGCSGYPACKNTRPLSLGLKCSRPECGGEIVEKRSKKGRLFYGCSRFPACDLAFWDKPVAEACPGCGSPFLLMKPRKDGEAVLACPNSGCRYQRSQARGN